MLAFVAVYIVNGQKLSLNLQSIMEMDYLYAHQQASQYVTKLSNFSQ